MKPPKRSSRARRSVLLALLLSPAAASAQTSSGTVAGVTLRRCFEWARASSETLAMKREDIAGSKARARAALGGAFPRIGWEFSDTFQDPKGVNTLQSRGFSGFVEKQQTESRFTATQPIFSGLKEYSAWSGLGRESARDELRLARAASELYSQVSERFYAVLADETELANTKAAQRRAEDRVRELSSSFRLGKARESEVFSAKARVAALRGSAAEIVPRMLASRAELFRLTRRDELLTAPLKDELAFPMKVADLEVRIDERADLRAMSEDVEARRWRVRYERGSYWPSVDLAGDYYTKRATFLEEIKWDVRLGVRVPLYQGGSVSANVRAAESALRQAQLAAQERRLAVFSSVSALQAEVDGAVKEGLSLDEAAGAATQAYGAILKEYKLGLATNLEVLSALDALQQQTSARDAAHYRAKRLYARLMAELERVP